MVFPPDAGKCLNTDGERFTLHRARLSACYGASLARMPLRIVRGLTSTLQCWSIALCL
jgi:hypothetical protein